MFLRPHSFLSLFGERKESPPRQKKRAALHFRLTPKAPYSLAPSSVPNCDCIAGSQFGSGERPWNPRRMEFENDMVSFVGADDSVRPAVGKDGFAEVCGEILVR